MFKHILVSTDGSEVAQRGVDRGLSLAKDLGAKVTIITVTDRFPIYAGSGFDYPVSDYTAGLAEAANRLLAAAKQAADRLGVTAETLYVPDANSAEAIIEAAKSKNCDLITMGSHGRRGLGRLLLGSTTSEVLAHSPVPVLVVK